MPLTDGRCALQNPTSRRGLAKGRLCISCARWDCYTPRGTWGIVRPYAHTAKLRPEHSKGGRALRTKHSRQSAMQKKETSRGDEELANSTEAERPGGSCTTCVHTGQSPVLRFAVYTGRGQGLSFTSSFGKKQGGSALLVQRTDVVPCALLGSELVWAVGAGK